METLLVAGFPSTPEKLYLVAVEDECETISQAYSTTTSSYRVIRALVGSSRRANYHHLPPQRSPTVLPGRWCDALDEQAFHASDCQPGALKPCSSWASHQRPRINPIRARVVGSQPGAWKPCSWRVVGALVGFTGIFHRHRTTRCIETSLVEGFPPTLKHLYRSSWRWKMFVIGRKS